MNTLNLCKKLISYRSVTNNREICKEIVEFVIDYIQKGREKVYIRRFVYEGRQSVLFTTQDSLEIDFLMVGHLDVVPGEESLYIPKERKGILYGRGACDMKGTVSAMIQVFKDSTSKKNIGLYLSTDEEEGGEYGAGKIVGIEGFSCNTVFVPDSLPNWTLTVGQKGVDIIKISSKGKSCHSSELWLGKNAIDILIGAYGDLKKEYNGENRNESVTVSLNKIQGGNAVNVVPEKAEIVLDVRYPTEKDRLYFLKRLKNLCNRRNIKWEVMARGECINVEVEDVRIKRFLNIVLKRGIEYRIDKECGSSDARYFNNATACIMFMPVCGGAHEDEEWLNIETLYVFEDILREYVGLL